MVFPSENITTKNSGTLLLSDNCKHLIMTTNRVTPTSSNLGVFPLLLATDSFPLPAENDLGCEGTVSAATWGPSILISVVGPELLLS